MNFEELIEKWKQFVKNMNVKGIPVPTIRDPKTGFGSVSLTLVFISSVIVIVGIIGKTAGLLGGLDMNIAMEFFWTAISLYFGRQFQTKSGLIFGQSMNSQPAQVQSQSQLDRSKKVDDPDAL